MTNAELFLHETDYPDFQSDAAVEHLRGALRFPTVSHVDVTLTDPRPFEELHAYLKESYPAILASGTWETIGSSILITVPGTDPSLAPALFMAHQDVVPIQPGTEDNWKHGPFSGDLEDGYIWGRGAMDIKEMLIGHLEALEYWLRQGRKPKRTVCLAFGEDEETCSQGAMALVRTLKERGVRPVFVLDEGSGDVMDAADYGAPGSLVCTVGMYEKGYADLRLTARGRGGHSSNPFHGTSLGALAKALTAVQENAFPPVLSDSLKSTLKLLAPHITAEPMRTYVQDMEKYRQDILKWCLKHPSLYHQVMTTIAPTQISAGAPAANVLPGDMYAVVNMRLIPENPPESVMAHFRALLDPGIELQFDQQIAASRPSSPDSWGYQSLVRVLEHYFDRLIFIPVQNRGATDCRQYEEICDCCLRFGPFLEEEDICAEGIHGTNERISVRAYLQGVRVLLRLMEETCFES